ncbi:PAQR family membrane homeostasis protein TrhA ['Camptotheca acuminata' phytoplasma]|uniref:PAQR family membrane homeostasis protein TrhA n=1 Tax='Camptotheca acuminata' phytoplasma TaxID=3239192 RepID=UPI00351A019B
MKWPVRKTPKQTILEEILNSISHGIMVPISIGLYFLLREANNYTFNCSIFCFILTMCMLYLMSCLYHSLSFTRAKGQFKRFDHICIYLLIWGSFIPFLLFKPKDNINIIFFIFQTILILFGVLFKIFWLYKGEVLHLILFLLLGWSGILVVIFSWNIFIQEHKILLFLILGGLCYSFGVIFYKNVYKKYYHFIWHLCVVLGNLFHVFSIYYFIGIQAQTLI